ncbi:hypothetical protein ACIQGT_25785 [Streptomyces sp. NPDC093108]|uniref:hypothetical protein n=1 Tax=Streptomyces sp. NPDC093108 TaxID=3366030 RepID=UPI00382C9B28
MQNSVNEALADVRVELAGHLLGRAEPGLTHARTLGCSSMVVMTGSGNVRMLKIMGSLGAAPRSSTARRSNSPSLWGNPMAPPWQ